MIWSDFKTSYYLFEFVQNDSLKGAILNFFTQASEVVPHYGWTQTVAKLHFIISKGEGVIADDNTSDVALGTVTRLKPKWIHDLGNFAVISYSIHLNFLFG